MSGAIKHLQSDKAMKKFESMLGERASSFLTTVASIVSSNSMLKDADPNSVYLAAVTSATLDLPINPNLGFAYIIPYGNQAQFQMGYKGYIQLAQRSGLFKTISATEVYKGQLGSRDPLKGTMFDWDNKESDEVVGYVAYFELLNGFSKTLYMPKEEVKAHGKKYSKNYNRTTSIWKKDFDAMAIKTVIKLLLSKYAPLSVEMQKAVTVDQAVITSEDGDVEYPDSGNVIDGEDFDEKLASFTSTDDKKNE